MRPQCIEEEPKYRIDTIFGRHRVACSCGWTSAFTGTSTAAVEQWGSHQGRRSTDAIGSLRREQASGGIR